MSNRFIERIGELIEVLLVKMQLGFGKTTIIEPTSFAFSNGDVVVVVPRGFHIEKIRPLTCSNSTGKNFFLMII